MCFAFFLLSFTLVVLKTKASFAFATFFSLAEIYEWERNKCRNLAVLKSCCNEALKENSSSSSLALLLLILLLMLYIDDGYFLPGRQKIHLKVSNLFYEYTYMHRKRISNYIKEREREKENTQVVEQRRGRKMHWKYFARLFSFKLFVDILTGFIIPEVSHFWWKFFNIFHINVWGEGHRTQASEPTKTHIKWKGDREWKKECNRRATTTKNSLAYTSWERKSLSLRNWSKWQEF